MHAKMTRDRKKHLMNDLEHAVYVLQQEIAVLKSSLLQLAASKQQQQAKPTLPLPAEITPVTSPELTSIAARPLERHLDYASPEQPPNQSTQDNSEIGNDDTKKKRFVQHGFVLNER
jgi:hypothetical protein